MEKRAPTLEKRVLIVSRGFLGVIWFTDVFWLFGGVLGGLITFFTFFNFFTLWDSGSFSLLSRLPVMVCNRISLEFVSELLEEAMSPSSAQILAELIAPL